VKGTAEKKDKHYKIKDWPIRQNTVPREKGVRNQLLVDKDNILFHQYTLNLA
jgi:hypothetical protein